ncbi:DUF7344 domain-containing protein [Halomontanus rarus]|uniref:DUF7344 domain-containing protein n=1 Tax=Halomontanus rarus TaxID=3034020 RepID=UPI003CE52E92
MVLDLCRDQHRRIVLAILMEQQRAVSLNDLTKDVITYNHHLSITEAPDEVVDQIYLTLSHIHVPKLVDNRVVTYDRERQLVSPTERLDQLQPYLTTIIEMDPHLDIAGSD